MKAIVAWVAFLGIQGALAEERTEWQTPQQVLAAIDAGKVPDKPKVWHSPRGSVVLHGDLFGDGRHLAFVGGEGSSWAVAKDGAWVVAGALDVEPAWVPPGKKTTDEKYTQYYNCDPPQVPFVLKDLNGDRVPELLVAFNNGGYRTGYAITRKEGQGIKLMDLYSERGEPDGIGGFFIVNTIDSGRKAWWSGDTYYKWREGDPQPVATWTEDCYDPEKMRWIAVRHDAGGKDRAFDITRIGDAWIVRSCRWKQGVETAEEKDFATIEIAMEPAKQNELTTFDVEQTVVFEMVMGIPGSVLWQRAFAEKGEGFDYAKAVSTCQVKVEGGDEAKALFKRVAK